MTLLLQKTEQCTLVMLMPTRYGNLHPQKVSYVCLKTLKVSSIACRHTLHLAGDAAFLTHAFHLFMGTSAKDVLQSIWKCI